MRGVRSEDGFGVAKRLRREGDQKRGLIGDMSWGSIGMLRGKGNCERCFAPIGSK